jgi:hypothetical protein
MLVGLEYACVRVFIGVSVCVICVSVYVCTVFRKKTKRGKNQEETNKERTSHLTSINSQMEAWSLIKVANRLLSPIYITCHIYISSN